MKTYIRSYFLFLLALVVGLSVVLSTSHAHFDEHAFESDECGICYVLSTLNSSSLVNLDTVSLLCLLVLGLLVFRHAALAGFPTYFVQNKAPPLFA